MLLAIDVGNTQTVIGVYDPFFEGTKDEMPLVCDRFIRDFGEML